ncbi:hypothetical protein EV363DRAFT_1275725 [Boletus edulis]|nr:hypothetical protein EV363DRAFT_1275725 [Boletus edulis]
MFKLIRRLVRLSKFLLAFPSRLRLLSRCNAALGRLVSFLRSFRGHKNTFPNSPPHILCSDDPPPPAHRVLHFSDPHPVDPSADNPGVSGPTASPEQSASASTDPTTQPKSAWHVRPGVPDGETRYAKRKNEGEYAKLHIPAGKQSLAELPPLGWERFVHPEGNVLFYHTELHVFTDTYIMKDGLADRIVSEARELRDKAAGLADTQTELVLNVTARGKKWYYHYYFVDHVNRRLWWHTSVTVDDLFDKRFRGVTQLSQLEYLLEAYYWSHCEYYPYKRRPSKKVFSELKGMLSYAKADKMTSDTSLSQFALDELNSLLDVVNPPSGEFSRSAHPQVPMTCANDVGPQDMTCADDAAPQDEYSVCIAARLMHIFAANKFINFHGQECARLDADVYLFDEKHWEDWMVFKVLNFLLFWSLKEHTLRLRRVWANHIIIRPHWKDFVTRVTNELTRYTTFSTIMLAANMAFLAAPGVTVPLQFIIYGSALMTITSIVVSFVLLNVYANPKFVNPATATKILSDISKKVGIPYLAFAHSLPMALLVWAISLFFIALVYRIFVEAYPVVRIIFGIVYFIILLCLGSMGCMILYFFASSLA